MPVLGRRGSACSHARRLPLRRPLCRQLACGRLMAKFVGRLQCVPSLRRIPHLAIAFAGMGDGSSCQQRQEQNTQHLISLPSNRIGSPLYRRYPRRYMGHHSPHSPVRSNMPDSSMRYRLRRIERMILYINTVCVTHVRGLRHFRSDAWVAWRRPATRRAMMPMRFDERSSSFDDLFAKIAALQEGRPSIERMRCVGEGRLVARDGPPPQRQPSTTRC